MTKARLNFQRPSSQVFQALIALETASKATGIDASLLDLIKLRASQINGCSYCIDLHTREARSRGETEQRLYLLQAWREVSLYSDLERAAMAWTEAVTLVSETEVPDDVYEMVRQSFSEDEIVNLTLAITTINTWNRFAISFRSQLPEHKVTHA